MNSSSTGPTGSSWEECLEEELREFENFFSFTTSTPACNISCSAPAPDDVSQCGGVSTRSGSSGGGGGGGGGGRLGDLSAQYLPVLKSSCLDEDEFSQALAAFSLPPLSSLHGGQDEGMLVKLTALSKFYQQAKKAWIALMFSQCAERMGLLQRSLLPSSSSIPTTTDTAMVGNAWSEDMKILKDEFKKRLLQVFNELSRHVLDIFTSSSSSSSSINNNSNVSMLRSGEKGKKSGLFRKANCTAPAPAPAPTVIKRSLVKKRFSPFPSPTPPLSTTTTTSRDTTTATTNTTDTPESPLNVVHSTSSTPLLGGQGLDQLLSPPPTEASEIACSRAFWGALAQELLLLNPSPSSLVGAPDLNGPNTSLEDLWSVAATAAGTGGFLESLNLVDFLTDLSSSPPPPLPLSSTTIAPATTMIAAMPETMEQESPWINSWMNALDSPFSSDLLSSQDSSQQTAIFSDIVDIDPNLVMVKNENVWLNDPTSVEMDWFLMDWQQQQQK